mgnify:CR=1 FL=1
MKTIIFVCHGNICRSPAAEWVFKHLMNKYQLDDRFFVYSRATSTEEIGNDIYPPMKRALYNKEIPFFEHRATQITKEDYKKADYIFYMDNNNLRYLNYLIEDVDKKYIKITKYSEIAGDIEDPWYSGQFDKVLSQIEECCKGIIKNLK